MEADAQFGGDAAGAQDQVRRVEGAGAELAGQRQRGTCIRHGDAHDEGEVLRVLGLGQDLVEFSFAIEHKDADIVVEIRLADRIATFDRVQEGRRCARAAFAHQSHFVQRSDVEKADSGLVETIDHPGRRIGLDGVQRLSGEIVLEPAGRYGQTVRARARDRTLSKPTADQVQGRVVRFQRTRPPVRQLTQSGIVTSAGTAGNRVFPPPCKEENDAEFHVSKPLKSRPPHAHAHV